MRLDILRSKTIQYFSVRSINYIAPILYLLLLDQSSYVQVESSILSISGYMPLVLLGLPILISLEQVDTKLARFKTIYSFILLCSSLVLSVAEVIFKTGMNWSIICIVAHFYLKAVDLKITGSFVRGVFFESILYIMLLAILPIIVIGFSFNEAMMIMVFGTGVIEMIKFNWSEKIVLSRTDIVAILQNGVSNVAFSLLCVNLVIMSRRYVADEMSNADLLAIVRFFMPVVLLYQYYYNKSYSNFFDHSSLIHKKTAAIFAVFTVAYTIMLLGIEELMNLNFFANKMYVVIVAVYTYVWILNSMVENRVQRYKMKGLGIFVVGLALGLNYIFNLTNPEAMSAFIVNIILQLAVIITLVVAIKNESSKYRQV